MTAQKVSATRHSDEHHGKHQVVAQAAPMQQQGIGSFIDGEAACGYSEKPQGRAPERHAMVTEGPAVVPGKRNDKGDQPPQNIGQQGPPTSMRHQHHHDAPMHSSSSRAHQNEPGNAPPQAAEGNIVDKGLRSHEPAKHSRSLCIAVDDFGLHAGVCEAALLLAWLGRAQAIGCMVGAPAWAQWAPELEKMDAKQTEIGLHLDLTQHPLVLQPQRLGPLILRSWLRTLDRTSIRSEIRAQLDAFEQQTRRAPAYVDGHQHVHQFPVVRGELLAELQRRYAGNLPWLRNTARYSEAHTNTPVPWRQAVKPWTIEALGSAALARQARAQGFRQNAHLLGVHNFRGDEDSYLEWTRRWLGACLSGDLLMCHPSLGAHPQDPLDSSRQHEYQVLSGNGFGEWVQAEGIWLEPLGQTLSQGLVAPMRNDCAT